MSKITFTDKTGIASGLSTKFDAQDANEIKNSVNSLYDLIRSDSSVISTGLEQVVEFSSSLGTVNYAIKIQSVPDLGIEYITKQETGFTIKFIDEGLFDYIAIKNM